MGGFSNQAGEMEISTMSENLLLSQLNYCHFNCMRLYEDRYSLKNSSHSPSHSNSSQWQMTHVALACKWCYNMSDDWPISTTMDLVNYEMWWSRKHRLKHWFWCGEFKLQVSRVKQQAGLLVSGGRASGAALCWAVAKDSSMKGGSHGDRCVRQHRAEC